MSFADVNTKLLGSAKNFKFNNFVIPASPPPETTVTRTSRLASVSTSRRSSYNASSRLALNTPTTSTLEDILTCPTYKHWVREMARTEFVHKTAAAAQYSLPVPGGDVAGEGRERASSFSCGVTSNNDDVQRRKSRVQFGMVIEHSHSAVELSSRKDASDGAGSSQNSAGAAEGPATRDRHDSGTHYCLDLAISFDRKLSSSSLSEVWCRRFSNVAPLDNGENRVPLSPKLARSNYVTPPIAASQQQQHKMATNLMVPETIPRDEAGRRRSSVLSNRELSTCDEEPEHSVVKQVKRSTSDTILSLFPAFHGETFL